MNEDFIAKFEEEHGWTPDCAYDIIGEENIGDESRKLSDFEQQVKDLTVGDAIKLNRLVKIEEGTTIIENYLQKHGYELEL